MNKDLIKLIHIMNLKHWTGHADNPERQNKKYYSILIVIKYLLR